MQYSHKSRGVAFALCFFFGILGAHRFYVGKIGAGVLQFFTLGGLGVWSLIDLILILFGKFTDGNGDIIKYNNVIVVNIRD